ncbi:methionyl-tRNA formyltransferase [Thermovibrio sp.]
MGTPHFAVPSLKRLYEAGYQISLVITQPDRPAGRGKKITPPPVKVEAQRLGIEVYQPEKVKENEELYRKLKEISPDFIVVAAYGKILPKWLIELPKFMTVNVHASLLPKYRGASPIQAALLNGEKETGITIMKVIPELDAGDILSQKRVEIKEEDDAQTLHDRLAELGGELLVETLPKVVSGEVKPVPQDESKATYCPKIAKEMGRVDWSLPAERIFNMVRAFTPWPGAHTFFKGKRIKITKAKPVELGGEAGKVIRAGKELIVGAGKGALKVERLKPEGRKEITGEEFVRGYRVKEGDAFS